MLNSLASVSNLKLAWERILTASNLNYKQFLRHRLESHELAPEALISDVRVGIRSGWEPSDPLLVWYPKGGGLHRPLSLLPLGDQVVLQALANVCVEKLRSRRAKLERRTVFSNQLSSVGSLFQVRPWRDCYRDYQRAATHHFRSARWVLTFDLSAFYDTISHEILIHTVAPRSASSTDWEHVRHWLRAWSLGPTRLRQGHGIPQGPLASDMLAELFMVPVDEAMAARGYRYVRYVDDICIFAATEEEAQRAGVALEVACRQRGLIPNPTKYVISRPQSMDELMRTFPSAVFQTGSTLFARPVASWEDEMTAAVAGRPLRVVDKSRLRYVLFSASKSNSIRDKVLRLVARHPEHADAFCHFLEQYDKSKPIQRTVAQVLGEGGTPFTYLRYRMWRLAAHLARADPCWARSLMPAAEGDWTAFAEHPLVRWGVMSFLQVVREGGGPAIGRKFAMLPAAIQAELLADLPSREFTRRGVAAQVLRRSVDEACVGLAIPLVREGKSHLSFALRAPDLPRTTAQVFRGAGLVRGNPPSVDPIDQIVVRRYSVEPLAKWRKLLTRNHSHALQILRIADAHFESSPSSWLQHQDSFNDVVVRAIVALLHRSGLPGGAKTVGTNGSLVAYGQFIRPPPKRSPGSTPAPASAHPFSSTHPQVAAALYAVHDRRNRLPGSHPFSLVGGVRSRPLTPGERTSLKGRIAYFLQELPSVLAFL